MKWTKAPLLGVSAAASWAWGTSLIVGMEIAQQKGLAAWFIWAIANAATLALFGWLFETERIPAEIYSRPAVKAVGVIIQLFCLVIQLNAIYTILLSFMDSGAYLLTSALGIIIALLMFKNGLRTSVKTDIAQWAILIVSVLAILGVALAGGAPRMELAQSATGDIWWGIWSACILLSAPIGDVQHWQRARVMEGRAYFVGSIWFAIYLALVLAMACFEFSPLMNVILLVAVLCVTTSTMDSIAVALHEAGGKKIGTCVFVLFCIVWGATIEMGILNIWTKFGVVRVGFALAILAASYFIRRRKNANSQKETS